MSQPQVLPAEGEARAGGLWHRLARSGPDDPPLRGGEADRQTEGVDGWNGRMSHSSQKKLGILREARLKSFRFTKYGLSN